MPITIQEIIASDTISQLVDKTNFNFDQILLNGGGPAGPKGIPGPTGPAGGNTAACSEQNQSPGGIPNLFRVFGNSKGRNKPYFNDRFFEQTRFCNQWRKTAGLDFYPTPPPNIQPLSRVKNVGRNPQRANRF